MKRVKKKKKTGSTKTTYNWQLSKQELEKFDIELIEEMQLRFKCRKCGAVWAVVMVGKEDPPANYWQCPNGCNLGVIKEVENGRK